MDECASLRANYLVRNHALIYAFFLYIFFSRLGKRTGLMLSVKQFEPKACAFAPVAGCRAIGIDVSSLCIAMAKEVAREEGLTDDRCSFYEADATLDSNIILAGKPNILSVTQSVCCDLCSSRHSFSRLIASIRSASFGNSCVSIYISNSIGENDAVTRVSHWWILQCTSRRHSDLSLIWTWGGMRNDQQGTRFLHVYNDKTATRAGHGD